MARLGQHPRLAHLVLKGRELGQGRIAALLAAILSERDFLRLPPGQRDVDLRHRVDIALSGKRDGALRLIQEQARRLMPRGAGDERPDVSMTGALLALAYPDRIGRRRAGNQSLSPVGRPRRCAAGRRSDGQRGVSGRRRSRRLGPGFAHLPRRADRPRRDRRAVRRADRRRGSAAVERARRRRAGAPPAAPGRAAARGQAAGQRPMPTSSRRR